MRTPWPALCLHAIYDGSAWFSSFLLMCKAWEFSSELLTRSLSSSVTLERASMIRVPKVGFLICYKAAIHRVSRKPPYTFAGPFPDRWNSNPARNFLRPHMRVNLNSFGVVRYSCQDSVHRSDCPVTSRGIRSDVSGSFDQGSRSERRPIQERLFKYYPHTSEVRFAKVNPGTFQREPQDGL